MVRIPRTVITAVVLLIPLWTWSQEAPELPDLEGTELTLSWQDFKSMMERMTAPVPTPPPPPKSAFLRSGAYRGRLNRGVLLLDATVQLEVLADGWAKVPLWSEGALVSFEGGGAVLTRGQGGVEVVARGPQSYTLRARLAFEAADNPGENRLSVRLPDAPLNLLEVSAGEGLAELEVESGVSYGAQPGRVRLALVGGAATLRYSVPFTRDETASGEELELDPRVLVHAYQLLDLGEGVTSGVLVLDYEVRVAEVDHFEVAVPPGVEVFDASAPGLESWKILQRDEGRVLRVQLVAPAEGGLRAVVSFESAYDPEVGEVTVPRWLPLSVERESGYVAISADGAEVELEMGGNLLPADVSEIPEDVRGWGGNLVTGYKYSGAPSAQGVVNVTEHEDAAVLMAIVERLNGTTVVLANGIEATWLDLVVKSNRKQFLKLRLPAGDVEIWSLLVDGEPARPKHSETEVLIPLPTAAGELSSSLSLVLLRRGNPSGAFATLRPALPRFDVPVSEALWTLHLPRGRLYTVADDDFSVVEETAALRPKRRAPSALSVLQSSSADYSAGAVSEETYGEQKKQASKIQQQLKARQGASRKGALPVRIAVPGGIGSMPMVTVARILMVDESETVLEVRGTPRWLRSLGRYLQVAATVGAGLLFGLLLAGRSRWLRPWMAGAVLLLAMIPAGGLGIISVVVIACFVAFTVWIGSAVARRRQKGESI